MKVGPPFFERMDDPLLNAVYQYTKHTALKKQLGLFNLSMQFQTFPLLSRLLHKECKECGCLPLQ